jgi:catechol 2,3-dioxygenase-like lactoylglutathione lyase family enzyme
VLGDFLEISLATRDILASIEFYRKLGFSEAPVGSSWKHPYTVMTDGRLYLGLHERDAASPALSFVLPELTRRMGSFEALGIEFAVCNIELHHFNELGFLDPDGQMVTLLEARTYSPVHAAHVEASLCGYFLEYRMPVRRGAESAHFWEALGLIVTPPEEGVTPYHQASWSGINLGLQEAGPKARPTLVFTNGKLEETAALLDMHGLEIQKDTQGLRLTTPEGLNLLLCPEEP